MEGREPGQPDKVGRFHHKLHHDYIVISYPLSPIVPFCYPVNLSRKHWRPATWGRVLADAKSVWRGRNASGAFEATESSFFFGALSFRYNNGAIDAEEKNELKLRKKTQTMQIPVYLSQVPSRQLSSGAKLSRELDPPPW